MKTPEVGQKVYYVPRSRAGQPRNMVVTKIGTKYFHAVAPTATTRLLDQPVTLFRLGTWREEAGINPGQAWESREAYEAQAERAGQWQRLRAHLSASYIAPDGVTTDDINAAAKLLRLEL